MLLLFYFIMPTFLHGFAQHLKNGNKEMFHSISDPFKYLSAYYTVSDAWELTSQREVHTMSIIISESEENKAGHEDRE